MHVAPETDLPAHFVAHYHPFHQFIALEICLPARNLLQDSLLYPISCSQDFVFWPIADSKSCRWTHIAQTIYRNYRLFDAFVILHGTDSLAYTCSVCMIPEQFTFILGAKNGLLLPSMPLYHVSQANG